MTGISKRAVSAFLIPLLVASVLTVPVGPVAAQSEQVIGSPGISASVADNRLSPSEQTTLAVTLSNSGQVERSGPAQFVEQVSTARNVQVSIAESRIDAPIEVNTGTITLGALQNGGVQQATFSIETGEDLKPGTYTIPIEVSYSYTHFVNYDTSASGYSNIEYVDGTRTKTIEATVVVEQQPSFSITPSSNSELTAGGTDTFEFTISNDGRQQARDIAVQFSSQNPTVRFGSASQASAETSVFIPSLAPGESYNGSVRVTSTDGATEGYAPIQATVSYETPAGIAETSDAITVGQRLQAEQRFSFSDVSSTLRAGDEGNLTATLHNQGPTMVSDAVVSIQANTNGIQLERTEFAVGSLASGESETIRFPITVSDSVDAGPYQFSHTVTYQDRIGTEQRSNSLNTRVQIASQRATFTVSDANTPIQVGASEQVAFNITNNGDKTLRNINAKAFVDAPLTLNADTAYIPTLEPGETATVTFEVSAGSGAALQPQPIEMDFQYEQPDGETVLSDTYQVAIELTPSTESGLPIPLIVGGVVVLLVVAGLIYRRR